MAVLDARGEGLSVRQAAAALDVPKSTVARHWNPRHVCVGTMPTRGSEQEWRDAHADVWSHDPDRDDDWMPYRWTVADDGTTTVEAGWRGVLTTDPESGKRKLTMIDDDHHRPRLPEGATLVAGYGALEADRATGDVTLHLGD